MMQCYFTRDGRSVNFVTCLHVCYMNWIKKLQIMYTVSRLILRNPVVKQKQYILRTYDLNHYVFHFKLNNSFKILKIVRTHIGTWSLSLSLQKLPEIVKLTKTISLPKLQCKLSRNVLSWLQWTKCSFMFYGWFLTF